MKLAKTPRIGSIEGWIFRGQQEGDRFLSIAYNAVNVLAMSVLSNIVPIGRGRKDEVRKSLNPVAADINEAIRLINAHRNNEDWWQRRRLEEALLSLELKLRLEQGRFVAWQELLDRAKLDFLVEQGWQLTQEGHYVFHLRSNRRKIITGDFTPDFLRRPSRNVAVQLSRVLQASMGDSFTMPSWQWSSRSAQTALANATVQVSRWFEEGQQIFTDRLGKVCPALISILEQDPEMPGIPGAVQEWTKRSPGDLLSFAALAPGLDRRRLILA